MSYMHELPMFEGSQSTIDFWQSQHGKRFIVNGLAYTIDVSVIMAVYPRREERLSVYARPVNRRSKVYKQVKANLGDDWDTDVLGSFDFECEILRQIALQESN